jgi:hypothetical protein
MAYEAQIGVATLEANGDLSLLQFRAVKMVGAQSVGPVAAVTDKAFGVLQNKPNAVGQAASVCFSGITKGEAGAAIAGGVPVTLDSVGRFITAVSTNNVWGIAMTAAGASGDVVSVMFSYLGALA